MADLGIRTRDILDQVSDLIFVAEPGSGRILDVNRSACERLGYRREELLDMTVLALGPPEEAESGRRILHEISADRPVVYERHLRRHDDILIACEVSIRRTRFDNREVIVGVARDIGERKSAEAALRESQRTLATLIGNLPGLVYRCRNDKDWTTEFVSDGVFPLTGYPPSDFREGKVQMGQLVHPDDREPVWNAIQTALKEQRPYTLTYRLHTASGQEKWVWEQGQGIYASSGELLYLEGFITDISDRKHAEAALQQSEQRLRNIIDGLGPSMFVGLLSTEGVVLEANQQALAAAGLKPEDVLGKPVEETYWFSYSEESKRQIRAAVTRAARGEASRYDVQIRAAENQFIPLDFSVQPFRNATGRVVLLVPSAIVITERKLAEQALRESEERLRLALDAAHMGTFDWDVPNNRITWSRWHEELWGFKPGEFAGTYESFSERVHPEDLPGLNAEVERCLAARKPYAREFRVVRPDGSVHWISGRGEFTFGADGQPLRMRGVVVEITARKQAEENLRASEHQLRLFVEHSPAAIAMFDNEMRYLVASRRWSEDYGLGDQNIVGRSHYEIFPEIPERWKAIHRRCLAGAVERREEDPFVRADGRTDWVRWEVRPWRKASGEIGGIIIFSEVITATKEAERKIAADAERLEQLSRRLLAAQEDERRRVARELHDELGQALTVIKINLQARERLKDRTPAGLDAENIRIVDDALQQVRRLALALRPSMLDDLGLLPALRWMAEQTAGRAGFAVHLDADIPELRLSPEVETACFRIAQEALTNIARHARAERVTIELRREDGMLALAVQDDGRGFDTAAVLERTRAGGSTGVLGMQERAALAGGRLEMESMPGRGTTVRARVPWRLAGTGAETAG
jgi:PAS domain S-box-containing protein